MDFILHRGGDQRFVLQNARTGGLSGLMFPGLPTESRRAFEYDYGSANGPEEVLNLQEFPELAGMPFFTLEYPGCWQFEQVFRAPGWEAVRPLFGLAAPMTGCCGSSTGVPLATPLWQYTPPNPRGSWKIPVWGLWVNQEGVWMGDRDGQIQYLDHAGEVLNQTQLSKTSRCFGERQQQIYVSCDDGQIYDLTGGKLPRAVFNARTSETEWAYDFMILALVVQADVGFVLDNYGYLTCLDRDWQVQWQVKTDLWQGWFLQADDPVVYVGHYHGLTGFDRQTGQQLWFQATSAPVSCGVMGGDRILLGTSDGNLYSLLKSATPELQQVATCASPIYACTLALNGTWLMVTDYQSTLYGICLDGSQPICRYAVDCGAILKLQAWDHHLYAVTTDGTIECFELRILLSGC